MKGRTIPFEQRAKIVAAQRARLARMTPEERTEKEEESSDGEAKKRGDCGDGEERAKPIDARVL